MLLAKQISGCHFKDFPLTSHHQVTQGTVTLCPTATLFRPAYTSHGKPCHHSNFRKQKQQTEDEDRKRKQQAEDENRKRKQQAEAEERQREDEDRKRRKVIEDETEASRIERRRRRLDEEEEDRARTFRIQQDRKRAEAEQRDNSKLPLVWQVVDAIRNQSLANEDAMRAVLRMVLGSEDGARRVQTASTISSSDRRLIKQFRVSC